jgi:hypothetical protein
LFININMSLKVVLQFERCDFEELKECFSRPTLEESIQEFVSQMGRLGIEVVTEPDEATLVPSPERNAVERESSLGSPGVEPTGRLPIGGGTPNPFGPEGVEKVGKHKQQVPNQVAEKLEKLELTTCDDSSDDEDVGVADPRTFLKFKNDPKSRGAVAREVVPQSRANSSSSETATPATKKGKPIGSVVLHTGYTKKGANDVLDLLTGDTSTFEAVLKQIGFNGKGTYGGVPGSWFISSAHRSKALEAFVASNIECHVQKWVAKKPTAPSVTVPPTDVKQQVSNGGGSPSRSKPERESSLGSPRTQPPTNQGQSEPVPPRTREEKGKEKEERTGVVVSTPTPTGPTIKTTINAWGNRWEPTTEMVMVKSEERWVMIGVQDQESQNMGIASLLPLAEYDIEHCLAKGWRYDTSLLESEPTGRLPIGGGTPNPFGPEGVERKSSLGSPGVESKTEVHE